MPFVLPARHKLANVRLELTLEGLGPVVLGYSSSPASYTHTTDPLPVDEMDGIDTDDEHSADETKAPPRTTIKPITPRLPTFPPNFAFLASTCPFRTWLDHVHDMAPVGFPITRGPQAFIASTPSAPIPTADGGSSASPRCRCCAHVTHLQLPSHLLLTPRCLRDLLAWFPTLSHTTVDFHVSDASLRAITTLRPRAVEVLDLAPSATLSPSTVVAALTTMHGLRELVLHETNATDAALRVVADGACPSLRALKVVRSRGVTDAGVTALAAALATRRPRRPLPHLRHLSLCALPLVTDASVAAVLRARPHLQELSLNQLLGATDASLSLLAGLPAPSLRTLELQATAVSSTTLRAVLLAHPQLVRLDLAFCEAFRADDVAKLVLDRRYRSGEVFGGSFGVPKLSRLEMYGVPCEDRRWMERVGAVYRTHPGFHARTEGERRRYRFRAAMDVAFQPRFAFFYSVRTFGGWEQQAALREALGMDPAGVGAGVDMEEGDDVGDVLDFVPVVYTRLLDRRLMREVILVVTTLHTSLLVREGWVEGGWKFVANAMTSSYFSDLRWVGATEGMTQDMVGLMRELSVSPVRKSQDWVGYWDRAWRMHVGKSFGETGVNGGGPVRWVAGETDEVDFEVIEVGKEEVEVVDEEEEEEEEDDRVGRPAAAAGKYRPPASPPGDLDVLMALPPLSASSSSSRLDELLPASLFDDEDGSDDDDDDDAALGPRPMEVDSETEGGEYARVASRNPHVVVLKAECAEAMVRAQQVEAVAMTPVPVGLGDDDVAPVPPAVPGMPPTPPSMAGSPALSAPSVFAAAAVAVAVAAEVEGRLPATPGSPVGRGPGKRKRAGVEEEMEGRKRKTGGWKEEEDGEPDHPCLSFERFQQIAARFLPLVVPSDATGGLV
ncbi:hypothetical protein HDU96_007500 [Phlyctochytrium bullatum]|nr:hypothetical protein HDU96_007500 [Phlyctochytrium bullatum]